MLQELLTILDCGVHCHVHSHNTNSALSQEISSMLLDNATSTVCRKHSQAQMSNPTHSKYVHFEIEL